LRLFKYELKRTLKKPIIILIIALIFFLGINMFNEMKYFNDKIKYNREIKYSYITIGPGKNTHEQNKQAYLAENKINEFNLLDSMSTYAEMAVNDYDSGNFQEAYKNEIIVCMLSARWPCNDAKKTEFLRNSIGEIWSELLPEIKYDDFKISDSIFLGDSDIKLAIIDIKYKYDLYSKNIRMIDNYSLNNVTFTYNMINKYLPFILAIFVILTTFNCISDEYRTGVVKNIATQGIKRSKYYLTMILANFLSAVVIISSTMIVLNFLVGFLAGFQSMDTPIISHEKQCNTISVEGMDLEKAYKKSLNRAYLGPTEVNYDDLATILFEDYKFITFKTFLIEAVGVYLLFAFFLTALSVFISSIFADKMKVLMTLIVIMGIGYWAAYAKPSIFNVFSTSRVTQIITGSVNFTLLGSFIVLGISILIILLVGIAYFKRKDITY